MTFDPVSNKALDSKPFMNIYFILDDKSCLITNVVITFWIWLVLKFFSFICPSTENFSLLKYGKICSVYWTNSVNILLQHSWLIILFHLFVVYLSQYTLALWKHSDSLISQRHFLCFGILYCCLRFFFCYGWKWKCSISLFLQEY